MANGGLITDSGVELVVLAADFHSVPVVVISALYKLTPLFPFDNTTYNKFLSPESVLNSTSFTGREKVNVIVSSNTFNYRFQNMTILSQSTSHYTSQATVVRLQSTSIENSLSSTQRKNYINNN